MRFGRLAFVLSCALGAGCATGRPGRGPRPAPLPVVSGVWEGVSRSTLSEGIGAGDTRIERHAWRLTQSGELLAGFYVVELTMISGDGRPYLCSRAPRFQTVLRFEVRGRVTAEAIELEEVGDARARGPCRPTFRSPARFRAALQGEVLVLSDGERRLPLYRRPAAEAAEAVRSLLAYETVDASWEGQASFPALEGPRPGEPDEPPADVSGVWVWEHRGTMPSGDEKVEREEWHLRQDGTRVTGYYDRAVRQISTDGLAYRCNSALDFRVVTRYQVTGEVRGKAVTFYERAFEILEASPCDDGRRRLDAYQGQATGGEIRLLWGVGAQVLRRARPSVPTQRF